MKRVRIVLAAAALVVTVAIALTLTAATPDDTSTERVMADDSGVAAILSRSCADCHSANTQWPWYSRIPPVGRLIRNDTAEGRKHLDLSRWSKFSKDDKMELLSEIGAVVRSRQMPPSRYLLIHRDASLSADDVSRVYTWTMAERRRLRASEANGQSR